MPTWQGPESPGELSASHRITGRMWMFHSAYQGFLSGREQTRLSVSRTCQINGAHWIQAGSSTKPEVDLFPPNTLHLTSPARNVCSLPYLVIMSSVPKRRHLPRHCLSWTTLPFFLLSPKYVLWACMDRELKRLSLPEKSKINLTHFFSGGGSSWPNPSPKPEVSWLMNMAVTWSVREALAFWVFPRPCKSGCRSEESAWCRSWEIRWGLVFSRFVHTLRITTEYVDESILASNCSRYGLWLGC